MYIIMIVVSNFSLLMRGLSLPYRINGFDLRCIRTQMRFTATLGTQYHFNHCSRKCVIHDYAPCINTVKRPDHPKANNIMCNQHHTPLEGNMFFKDKGKNEEASRKRRVKMYMLLGLSLLSSKEEGKEEKESELITMIKRGILALKNGELNKAEQLLHIALKTAQEGQNRLAITYIFDLLANLAYQREEYSKAENLFKEVLQRMLADGMPEDDNAVVEISLKLASVYASRKDYEKAVEGFHFCIGTQEAKIKKFGEKDLDEDTLLLWAMSMDWYARFLLSIQKYEMAKIHFIKAYEMSERVNGPGHSQTAVLLNDIGSVCSLQKNYAEAVEYLEKAIDAARISQSADIASFYVNLGAIYLQQEMLSNAERYCKEGLALARKMKNEEAVDEANSCLAEINNIKKKK